MNTESSSRLQLSPKSLRLSALIGSENAKEIAAVNIKEYFIVPAF
jgi:hypothetical protein